MKIKRWLKKNKNWAKYEPAGCFACSAGQLYSGGREATSITYYDRCSCSTKYTKEYKLFLKYRDELKHKFYKKYKWKFYDNNSHITVGNNATDRSW